MAVTDIRDLLGRRKDEVKPPSLEETQPPAAQTTGSPAAVAYVKLKNKLHHRILEKVDLVSLESMSESKLREEIATLVELLLTEDPAQINDIERRMLVRDIQNEMLGLGPLELLMADPTVSDILVNSYDQIYVERRGKLELTDVVFSDEKHLLRIIDKIVSRVGRRIDESSPMVDARLPDGSRVNAIIPPIALDGPMVSIRRFAVVPLKMGDLVDTLQIADSRHGAAARGARQVEDQHAHFRRHGLRQDDAAQHPVGIHLRKPNASSPSKTRPNCSCSSRTWCGSKRGRRTSKAKAKSPNATLVRNALRMRPDRIVIGEVRGAEAVDMLQAMNTGHEGSLTTIHANTPRDAIARLENMVGMAGINLPHKAARQQIASAITVIVQVNRLTDGNAR